MVGFQGWHPLGFRKHYILSVGSVIFIISCWQRQDCHPSCSWITGVPSEGCLNDQAYIAWFTSTRGVYPLHERLERSRVFSGGNEALPNHGKRKLAREVSPAMMCSDLLGYNLQSVICVAVGLQRWVIHAGWIGQPHLVLSAIASRPFG